MLRIISTLLLAAVLGFSGPALAQSQDNDVLKVGMSGHYFPFTFVDHGDLKGFEVDMMKEIADRIGMDVKFVTSNFSGLFGMLGSGRIDTIANEITITPQRKQVYVFTQPYVYTGAQIVTRKGNDEIHGVQDLRGKTVGVSLGSNFEKLLRELPFADQINIRTYQSNVELDVALGRIDAFVMDRVSSIQLIKKKPLPLQLAGKPFTQIHNALPFRDTPQGRALRDRVNKAITAMKKDGTLTAISKKWFGQDITHL